MSQLIPSKEFDQWSSFSFKSHISNMEFTSPLPLPINKDKIPTNQEVGDAYQELQKNCQDLNPNQLLPALYHNLIAPKIQQERALSEVSGVSKGSSRFSLISNAAKLDESMVPFKVHPNESQLSLDPNNKEQDVFEGGFKISKKKRRPTKQKEIKKLPEIKSNIGQNQQNLKKAQNWKSQQNKEHHLFSKTNQFTSKQQEVKYAQKRLAAKAFCQRGSGFDKLKEEVWQTKRQVLKMEKKRYQVICSAFITQSYRKLEQFLIDDCQRNIKNLTSPQMRALIPILLASQLRFDDQEHLTWRKFIRVTYDLSSVSIFQQNAAKLYMKIQLCLRGRIGALKLDKQYRHVSGYRQMLRSPGRFLNQRLEVQSIWTKQLQFEYLDVLLQAKTVAKARDVLRMKYRDVATLNNVKQLKARFFRILRIAVKRLMKYYAQQKHNLPTLIQFDDDKVKVLVRHPLAKECRWALARLYKTNGLDRPILVDAINKVNQFCFIQQTREESSQSPKEPIINSVTDKIKHNLKVSRKLLKKVTTAAQRAGPNSQLLFLKKNDDKYQHIISLQHKDKLHYFRKVGVLNSKGGFQYEDKPYDLRRLELEQGDDDSNELVYITDDDYDSAQDQENES